MYDIISNIISHAWNTNSTSEQQIIYYICGALIIVFVSLMFDLIYRLFRHFWGVFK